MGNYNKIALDFAKKTGTKLEILNSEYKKHFADDKQERYVFKCKLTRKGKSYTFYFGQSLQAGCEDPTMYDVLTCLQKYDVGDFEDFCSEFGYDTDSRKAEKTYKAVCKEFKAVDRLFNDVMEELSEIE